VWKRIAQIRKSKVLVVVASETEIERRSIKDVGNIERARLYKSMR